MGRLTASEALRKAASTLAAQSQGVHLKNPALIGLAHTHVFISHAMIGFNVQREDGKMRFVRGGRADVVQAQPKYSVLAQCIHVIHGKDNTAEAFPNE